MLSDEYSATAIHPQVIASHILMILTPYSLFLFHTPLDLIIQVYDPCSTFLSSNAAILHTSLATHSHGNSLTFAININWTPE